MNLFENLYFVLTGAVYWPFDQERPVFARLDILLRTVARGGAGEVLYILLTRV